MILKRSDLNFVHFKTFLISKCPQASHESFAHGYNYLLNEFFDSLEVCILAYMVDIDVYNFDLEFYIEFIMDYLPFETSRLKVYQLPKFFEGVQHAITEASRLLELVAIKSENSIAA